MEASPSIIPAPVKLSLSQGSFSVDKTTRILVAEPLLHAATMLKNLLHDNSSFDITIEETAGNAPDRRSIAIVQDTVRVTEGPEAYNLAITPDYVQIAASKPQGAFYGVQTLRQLLDPSIETTVPVTRADAWNLPCVEIHDYPRFPWRGFMLDTARHFFGKDTILRLLDVLACLKMNVFHWHLTDDQGWRIEIKKYPKLIEIGSKRKDSQVGGYISPKMEGKPHEGHYTQDEAREIVAYAQDRCITVVPEIDTPGHSTAALASYPELSCTGGPFEVFTKFATMKGVYCIGKERTFTFLQDVLDEIIDIFPSKIIHIGGDETSTLSWKKCPDCKARMKAENLGKARELQTFFTNRVARMLQDRGRTLMGWNEVLAADLAPDAIVQFWTGRTKRIMPHLAKGRQFVMSPFFNVYIDHDYVLLPLKMVYEYDPVPKNLPESQHKNILGIEVPLWTEWVRNTRRMYWQLFPRLLAVAETGWTPRASKDYASFKARAEQFYARLLQKGMSFAPMDRVERKWYRSLLPILHLLFEPKVPQG